MPGPQAAVGVASNQDGSGRVPGCREGARLNARHGPEVLQAGGPWLHLEDADCAVIAGHCNCHTALCCPICSQNNYMRNSAKALQEKLNMPLSEINIRLPELAKSSCVGAINGNHRTKLGHIQLVWNIRMVTSIPSSTAPPQAPSTVLLMHLAPTVLFLHGSVRKQDPGYKPVMRGGDKVPEEDAEEAEGG